MEKIQRNHFYQFEWKQIEVFKQHEKKRKGWFASILTKKLWKVLKKPEMF